MRAYFPKASSSPRSPSCRRHPRRRRRCRPLQPLRRAFASVGTGHPSHLRAAATSEAAHPRPARNSDGSRQGASGGCGDFHHNRHFLLVVLETTPHRFPSARESRSPPLHHPIAANCATHPWMSPRAAVPPAALLGHSLHSLPSPLQSPRTPRRPTHQLAATLSRAAGPRAVYLRGRVHSGTTFAHSDGRARAGTCPSCCGTRHRRLRQSRPPSACTLRVAGRT
mmetsp:Transcript_23904/g.66450  ORF Transcript_23904/g.66450 Transcript_23904/m.66450 type:complete len:224 (+) Transcript_23904:198-869(+)